MWRNGHGSLQIEHLEGTSSLARLKVACTKLHISYIQPGYAQQLAQYIGSHIRAVRCSSRALEGGFRPPKPLLPDVLRYLPR